MTIVVARRQNNITMEGSASSINSRATAIKTILLAAWRGKLSNEEWESRIRKILPKGVNGDVYDLADCLLKQALVGPVSNQLFISYLKHAVSCELISHGAVLSSIAHQATTLRQHNTSPIKTSSVICLLEFLKTFRAKISCKGSEVECLNLCHSVSQLIHWLLKCIQHSLDTIMIGNFTSINSINSTPQTNTNIATNTSGQINLAQHESIIEIIDLCTEAIHYFTDRPFTKSLLFISKVEYSKEFDDILKAVQVIQQKLTSSPNLQFIQEKVQHYRILQQLNVIFNSKDTHPSVVAAQQLRCLQMHRIRSTDITSGCNIERKIQQSLLIHDSTTNYALFNSLYPLIAFDVVLRPARSHKSLAHQVATITDFNSAPLSMTYCELIRICLIGLIDTFGSPVKVKWAFFTFLKMPKLLIELSKTHKSPSTQDTTNYVTSFINDLTLAFERLCEYSPLLDEAEYKCNCDFFGCLVEEICKTDKKLSQLEQIDYRKLPTKRQINNSDKSVGGYMMLKTEPVVTSMLETFDAKQDPPELFAIISQLVSGKHFEFTLNAAASSGRLQMFVKKLVEHNELNRVAKSDSSRSSHVQALIFDITFLILTYISQHYGAEVIGTDQQTTFNKWYYDCYNTSSRINCPKEVLKDNNGDIVSSLIKQLVDPAGGGIQTKNVDWREVCFNAPKAISEIIIAWNQGQLTDIYMRGVTERMKSKMCFIAVVAATWLQSYIKTLNEVEKVKPLFLLQSLTKSSQQAKQQNQTPSEPGLKSESYSERSSLMCSIVRKIYFELVPKTSTSHKNSSITATNPSNSNDTDECHDESAYQSINDRFISTLTTQEIFLANVKQCLSRGWIEHKSLNSLSSLFKMIGSECFTNLIVEQILTSHESPSDLSRAVNITFGLFHLDIEACAFALLKDTIPSWLMGEKKQVLLNQPRALALAHLTVMTIIEVFNNLKSGQPPAAANQVEDKKLPMNGIKQEPGIQKAILLDTDPNTNGPRDVKRIKLSVENNEKEQSLDVTNRLDRLSSCIADLMRLFKQIMSDPVMSQRTLFPVLFLQQTVICTREDSTMITAHLQPEILLDIINLFSSELTFELVLAISNLSTTNSRKFAAKAMCQLAQVKESKQSQPSPNQVSNLNNESASGKQSVTPT